LTKKGTVQCLNLEGKKTAGLRGDPRGQGLGKIFPRDGDRGRGMDSPAGRGSGKYPPLPTRPIDIPRGDYDVLFASWSDGLDIVGDGTACM